MKMLKSSNKQNFKVSDNMFGKNTEPNTSKNEVKPSGYYSNKYTDINIP